MLFQEVPLFKLVKYCINQGSFNIAYDISISFALSGGTVTRTWVLIFANPHSAGYASGLCFQNLHYDFSTPPTQTY